MSRASELSSNGMVHVAEEERVVDAMKQNGKTQYSIIKILLLYACPYFDVISQRANVILHRQHSLAHTLK